MRTDRPTAYKHIFNGFNAIKTFHISIEATGQWTTIYRAAQVCKEALEDVAKASEREREEQAKKVQISNELNSLIKKTNDFFFRYARMLAGWITAVDAARGRARWLGGGWKNISGHNVLTGMKAAIRTHKLPELSFSLIPSLYELGLAINAPLRDIGIERTTIGASNIAGAAGISHVYRKRKDEMFSAFYRFKEEIKE